MSTLNKFGKEVFDQTPVEFPINFVRPTPLNLRLRQQILLLQEDMKNSKEFDTPEEADDFEVPEDPEMWDSPYEGDFDHMAEEKFSAASNEESAKGGSSDGATQEKTEQA